VGAHEGEGSALSQKNTAPAILPNNNHNVLLLSFEREREKERSTRKERAEVLSTLMIAHAENSKKR
jgi:hypothetical protein